MNQELMQQLVTEVKRLQRRVGYLERLEKADGKAVDYSSLATIVGWSSFTTKILKYTKIGKLVFVQYRLIGTSDNTATSFTVPFTTGVITYAPTIFMDNGGGLSFGSILINTSNNIVNCYTGPAGTGWTASGEKRVQGQFFYMT